MELNNYKGMEWNVFKSEKLMEYNEIKKLCLDV